MLRIQRKPTHGTHGENTCTGKTIRALQRQQFPDLSTDAADDLLDGFKNLYKYLEQIGLDNFELGILKDETGYLFEVSTKSRDVKRVIKSFNGFKVIAREKSLDSALSCSTFTQDSR